MNDAELNRILKSAGPPRRPEEYWSDFPGRVTRQLNRPLSQEHRLSRWLPRLAWAGGLAMACVIVGFVLGHRFGQAETANGSGRLLQSEKLVHEVMAMFPNRVRAIVKDESGLQLVLSENASVPASTPLWIKVGHGSRSTTVVTFSGQELQIAGQKMTVLADVGGGVILMGDHFAWASDGPKGGVNGLDIQAQVLEFAAQ